MRAHELVDVDLLEDDELPAHRRRPARRAHGWRTAPLAVGLALLVASSASGARDLSDAVLAERLVDVPGLATPIDGPLPVRWSTAGTRPIVEAGGIVVARGPEPGELRGVAVRDGALRWSRVAPDESCRVVLDGAVVRSTLGALTGAGDETARLLCQSENAAAATSTRLAAVDLRTGVETGTVTAPGAARLAVVLDGDAVLLTLADDGHLAGLRWSLADGSTRWTYRSPDAGFGDGPSTVALELQARWAYVVGQRSVTLDLVSGTERVAGERHRDAGPALLRYAPVPAPVGLPDGGVAEQAVGPRGLPWVRATGQDGAPRYDVPGTLAEPEADDGTAADVLLVRSGGSLQGLDAATGATLWTHPVGLTPVARLRGVVVASGVGTVSVLDLADGTELWQAPVDGVWAADSVVTDGFVVVAGTVVDGGRAIVARDLVTGAERWRSPVPDGTVSLAALSDGTLLAVTHGVLVALGR